MNLPPPDTVSKELRKIEHEVDNFFKQNYLCTLPFAISAWHFMAFCEDKSIVGFFADNIGTTHDIAAFVDNFVNNLNYPFLWLKSSCPPNGKVPFRYNENCYQAAYELSNLGDDYITFESAFTCASRNLVELSIQGSTIFSTPFFKSNSQYEAYDRMIKRKITPTDFEIDKLYEIRELIENSLRIKGERFSYELNPKIVKFASEILTSMTKNKLTIPEHWQFPHYSIGDFRKFAISLQAISFIHFNARLLAAFKGCKGLGYSSSLFISDKEELLRRLIRYSKIPETVVLDLIEDMTYGNRNILKPDPAIQPIIKLNNNQLAVMPSLTISSNMERNFTILLNRLPSEKKIYSQLVSEKEELMKTRIIDKISFLNYKYYAGNILKQKNIPDIDLLIIDDIEKVCLFLELKWFIGPAEIREVIEKSEEIAKGIDQLLKLSNEINNNPNIFFDKLKIDQSYILYYAVVSDNSIGIQNVQNANIPVIQEDHLIKNINSTKSLRKTIDWLSNRNYLPIEGTHYNVVEIASKIGRWTIKWHGLEILIEGLYE
jgi:hypothetical protein